MKRITKESIRRTADHLACAKSVLRHVRAFWDWEANGGMGGEIHRYSINGGPVMTEAQVKERILRCKDHLRAKLNKFKGLE